MVLIDIEGPDGCGKATQTKMLFNYLTDCGYKCKLISFPNYASRSSEPVKMYLANEMGDKTNQLNGYQTSTIFAIDRLITMNIEDISNYDYVLFDRYTPSNMIHQSIKIEDEDKLADFLDWLEDFEYIKLNLPKPNKIIFLDLPPEFSTQLARERMTLKNGQSKDILEQDSTHQLKAYNRAKYVANKYNWITINCVEDNKIKSIDKIHKEIIKTLNL